MYYVHAHTYCVKMSLSVSYFFVSNKPKQIFYQDYSLALSEILFWIAQRGPLSYFSFHVCSSSITLPYFDKLGIYLLVMHWEHSSQMEAVDLVRKVDVKRPLPWSQQTHTHTQTYAHKCTHVCILKHTYIHTHTEFSSPYHSLSKLYIGFSTCCAYSY